MRFQLWALRRAELDLLGPQELVDIWRGPEWFAQTATEASGSDFVELRHDLQMRNAQRLTACERAPSTPPGLATPVPRCG